MTHVNTHDLFLCFGYFSLTSCKAVCLCVFSQYNSQGVAWQMQTFNSTDITAFVHYTAIAAFPVKVQNHVS
jgi:hypothetical protein